jgi:hypothetical protein
LMNKLTDGIWYLWWGLGIFFVLVGWNAVTIVRILKG